MLDKLKKAYKQVLTRLGDPLNESTLYGPLHSADSVERFNNTIKKAVESGGKIEFGGKVSCVQNCFIKRLWNCSLSIYFLLVLLKYFVSSLLAKSIRENYK